MTTQVLQAVQCLYHHPDESVKKQANEWLQAWQHSQDAWNVSGQILRDPNAGLDAQYFCAQTLRTKVRQDFEELPAESASGLCESLLECLRLYALQTMVRTQLSLAFAALVAHLPRHYWGPQGVLSWLVTKLQSLDKQASVPVMVELMIILPEEASSYLPSVRPDRRRELTEDLQKGAPLALQILATCLENQDYRERVLEAFGRWLNLVPCGRLPPSELAIHPLTSATIEGLKSDSCFNEAVEATVELIHATADQGQPGAQSAPLVNRIIPEVLGLLPRFERCVLAAQAESRGQSTSARNGDNTHTDATEDLDDEDFAKGCARLFVELGEAYTTMIASGTQSASKPVEAILQVAAHPDNEISSMSYNFWHRLSKSLTSQFGSQANSSQGSKKEVESRCQPFLALFSQLVTLIASRVKYDSFEAFEKLHDEDKQDFRQIRSHVADTVLDAAHVLGEVAVLQLLVQPLEQISGQTGNIDWTTIEAALQCIRSVHRVVVSPSNPIMVKVIESLPQLPKIPKLQYTACMVVESYAFWISATLRDGNLQKTMPQLLDMLSQGLTMTECASAAALAVNRLCEACGGSMRPFLDALTQLYNQVQQGGALSPEKQALSMDEEDVQQVMQAVVSVVANLPADQRRAAMSSMLTQIVSQLMATLENDRRSSEAGQVPDNSAKAEQDNQTLALFDRLTVILRYIDDSGAVIDVLTKLLPIIQAAMQQYAHSAAAVERIVRALRYGLRTAGKEAVNSELIPSLMTAIPQWFSAGQHCCYLYLTSELVKIFGDTKQLEPQLAQLVKAMLQTALQGLKELKDFNNNPDVADDTFLLISRSLGYAPAVIFRDPALPALILQSAQPGTIVMHREANESVLTVLDRICDQHTLNKTSPEAVAQLQQMLDQAGPTLVRLLIAGAIGMVPYSRIPLISEALTSILKLTSQKGLQWYTEALRSLPDMSASREDVQLFVKAAYTAVSTSDTTSAVGQIEAALSELSELVRRNRRAEEAAQQSLLPPSFRQAQT